MKKLLTILVLGLCISEKSSATGHCVPGYDLSGNRVIDCSAAGGGFHRETHEGSNIYRDDYGGGSIKTEREIYESE